MSPAIAPWRPSPSLATSVARKATYPVNAPTTLQLHLPRSLAVEVEVVELAPSAIAAARLGTSPARAPSPLVQVEAEVEDSLRLEAEAEPPQKLVIPAVALATCRVTVSRDPSVTTAPALATSAGTAPSRRSARATPVALRDTSRAIAPASRLRPENREVVLQLEYLYNIRVL